MSVLDDNAISSGLAKLSWERQGKEIVKVVKLADFKVLDKVEDKTFAKPE